MDKVTLFCEDVTGQTLPINLGHWLVNPAQPNATICRKIGDEIMYLREHQQSYENYYLVRTHDGKQHRLTEDEEQNLFGVVNRSRQRIGL